LYICANSSVAGYIGNYAETAGKLSKELLAQMEIIQDGSSNLQDPRVIQAVDIAISICLELSDEAKDSNKKCAVFVEQLSAVRSRN
jgi:hypothetical protein